MGLGPVENPKQLPLNVTRRRLHQKSPFWEARAKCVQWHAPLIGRDPASLNMVRSGFFWRTRPIVWSWFMTQWQQRRDTVKKSVSLWSPLTFCGGEIAAEHKGFRRSFRRSLLLDNEILFLLWYIAWLWFVVGWMYFVKLLKRFRKYQVSKICLTSQSNNLLYFPLRYVSRVNHILHHFQNFSPHFTMNSSKEIYINI